MADVGSRGRQVEPAENLYRAIPSPEWLNFSRDPPSVSSYAFKVNSPFSVNVASLIGLDGAIRHMKEVLKCQDGGIVAFNCGQARSLGYDARHEPDPNFRDNKAHANVYFDGTNSTRKKAAKKLAMLCELVHRPSFGPSR